jgi:transcriptional regulator GlxA family with amidase domain
MARRFEQQLRTETAEETRRRFLDAVAQRLRDAPTEPPSLDQVTKLARVARSTIYLIFGSHAGLFDVSTEDLAERTGLARLYGSRRIPRRAVAGLFAVHSRYMAVRGVRAGWNKLARAGTLDTDLVTVHQPPQQAFATAGMTER